MLPAAAGELGLRQLVAEVWHIVASGCSAGQCLVAGPASGNVSEPGSAGGVVDPADDAPPGADGRVRCHQDPRGVSGAFADVSRARNPQRHSSSCQLTTLVAGTKACAYGAGSVGRASGTRLVPAEPGNPVTGIAGTPCKEILMKRKLNLALWIVAGTLAVVFLVSSSTKLFVPKEKLAGMGGAASRWG